MNQCPYQAERFADGNGFCGIHTVAAGFTCAEASGLCERCIKDEAWNVDGVPQLKPEDTPRTPSADVAAKIVKNNRLHYYLQLQHLDGRVVNNTPINCGADFGTFSAVDVFHKISDHAGASIAEHTFNKVLLKHISMEPGERGTSDQEFEDEMEAIASEIGATDKLESLKDAYTKSLNS